MKKILMLVAFIAILGIGIFLVFNRSQSDSNEEMMNEEMNEEMDEEMMDEEMNEEMDEEMNEDMSDEMMTNDGEMATLFELEDLNGNLVSLSELKGEKVYIKFWASWCSICLAGLDDLDNFSGEMHDFKVYTIVSPDYNGEKNTEKFKAWFENQGTENLIVLLDEDGDITRSYGVRGYPTSAFIGSDGVLVHMYPGHIENDLITKEFMDIH